MDVENGTERRDPYPWARALMIVVLYGALLFFLWNFPTDGGREFFRTLFGGFLYVLAGVLLVGVTIVALLFFPLPFLPPALDDPDLYEDTGEFLPTLFYGRSLMVPSIKSARGEDRVREVILGFVDEFQPDCLIYLDVYTGIVTVAEADPDEADFVLDEINARLRASKISARRPK